MNPIWITGANGLIGNYFVQTAPEFAPRFCARALTREQFDLLDFKTLEREFKKDQPRLVIHCAAISSISETQKNPALAKKVNVEVVKFLAGLAAEIQFIFFSTDLVFDGRKGNYVETDLPNPITFYGETKVAAEQIVFKNPRHLIVRTSINGGISRAGNRGFNEQLKLSLQNSDGMKLFTDEFRSPIFAGETARAVWELADKNCAGIFHVAGAEKLSRWQIGQLLIQSWPEIKTKIEPGLAKDFIGPPRALDTSLDVSKVQKILSRPLPGLSEWLAVSKTKIENGEWKLEKSAPQGSSIFHSPSSIFAANYRGRLAPSPTGHLHLGHAKTFWVAQQRAKENSGELILRNDDLDSTRFKMSFVSAMIEDLRWFGFEWSEGPDIGGKFAPYNQSERMNFYRLALEKLRTGNFIYPCTCSRKDIRAATRAPHANDDDEPIYPGTCRNNSKLKIENLKFSWRFRVPDGETISFQDGNCGEQKFVAGKDFGDFVVWRGDDVPAYQLACAVDDAAMNISEVVRGADLLISTARQILIYRALGLTPPDFFHCELMLDTNGERLAKRNDALSLRTLRARGKSAEELRGA